MTVETRYFTSTIIDSMKKLLTVNTSSYEVVGIASGKRFGIRVWKVDSSDVEIEITAGTPVATVIHAGTTEDDGEYSATWALSPEMALASTDRIIVRVYSSKITPTSWQLLRDFITEALGASKLDAATWTVYYWLYVSAGSVSFFYGSSTYNSRITNFTWTAAAAAAIKRRLLVGVGL